MEHVASSMVGGVHTDLPPRPDEDAQPPLVPDAAAPRTTRRRRSGAPKQFEITNELRTWAEKQGVVADLDVETAKFLDHHAAKGTLSTNWRLNWNNWMRNTLTYGTPNGRRSKPANKTQPWER